MGTPVVPEEFTVKVWSVLGAFAREYVWPGTQPEKFPPPTLALPERRLFVAGEVKFVLNLTVKFTVLLFPDTEDEQLTSSMYS